jgi:hypothetical protein
MPIPRRDRVIGIVTGCGLDGPGIESRWCMVFPAVQTSPEANLAFYTMGMGSFPSSKTAGALCWPPLLLPFWTLPHRLCFCTSFLRARPVASNLSTPKHHLSNYAQVADHQLACNIAMPQTLNCFYSMDERSRGPPVYALQTTGW